MREIHYLRRENTKYWAGKEVALSSNLETRKFVERNVPNDNSSVLPV